MLSWAFEASWRPTWTTARLSSPSFNRKARTTANVQTMQPSCRAWQSVAELHSKPSFLLQHSFVTQAVLGERASGAASELSSEAARPLWPSRPLEQVRDAMGSLRTPIPSLLRLVLPVAGRPSGLVAWCPSSWGSRAPRVLTRRLQYVCCPKGKSVRMLYHRFAVSGLASPELSLVESTEP